MKQIKCVLIVLFAACMIGCVPIQERNEIPPPPGVPSPEFIDPNARTIESGFLLEEEMLKHFRSRAEQGDAEAAFKLSLHYMTLGEDVKANYWNLIASARGQASAQYNRWFELKGKNECASKAEALAWLKVSALSNNELAKKKLKNYALEVQSCFID